MSLNLQNLAIPPGWKKSLISKACNIHNNLRLPISVDERKKIQGEYPYYGPTGILDYIDHYRVEGKFALIGEDGDHFLKYAEKQMTLLVNGRFNVNNHAHIISGKRDCLTEWFFHFYRHANVFPYLSRQGAGRYKLNKATLEQLPILLPPLPEQRKIADILSTWDEAIAKTERLTTVLQTRKKGLIQRLLKGEVRFTGFDGKWKEVHLRDAFQRITRKLGDKKVENFLSITATVGFVDQREKFGRVIAGNNKANYVLLKKGEFSYNKGNSNAYPQGCIYLLEEFKEGAVPNVYFSFSVKSTNQVHPYFYKHYFESGSLNQQLAKYISSSARSDGLFNIAFDDFFKVTIPLPQLEEQKRIADVLNACDHEIRLQIKKLEALKQQKKGLMQRLLTGQVRVKV